MGRGCPRPTAGRLLLPSRPSFAPRELRSADRSAHGGSVSGLCWFPSPALAARARLSRHGQPLPGDLDAGAFCPCTAEIVVLRRPGMASRLPPPALATFEIKPVTRSLVAPSWVAIVLAIASASGCAALGKPDWLDPGPARNQQRRAVRFDPFMQSDIGPYAFRQYGIMDGTRPRDYAEPVPEVRRSRWWAPAQ